MYGPEDPTVLFYGDCLRQERLEFVQDVLWKFPAQTGEGVGNLKACDRKREEHGY